MGAMIITVTPNPAVDQGGIVDDLEGLAIIGRQGAGVDARRTERW